MRGLELGLELGLGSDGKCWSKIVGDGRPWLAGGAEIQGKWLKWNFVSGGA